MKVTYYCAMSRDEFIAREDGDVSWLDDLDMEESGAGYEEFFASVDALVMGRATYDFVFNYGSWPYGDIPTWVVTSTALEPLEGAKLSVVASVEDFLSEANARGMQHIWLVGGGKLASAFLTRGILTHLRITEMAIELGSGIPLFSDHELKTIEAAHTESTQKKGYQQLEIRLEE